MATQKRALTIRLLAFVAVLILSTYAGYQINLASRVLPYYNPSDLESELVDKSMRNVTKFHKIGSFNLVSQNGNKITEQDFEGIIYVADFFFATCQSMCPKMASQMQRLSDEFKDDPAVKFISHTVLPEMDSVPVLKEYAERYAAKESKWVLVTGDKKHIYDLARKSYFAARSEGDGGINDFIHTENFVLIDKGKRIRGFYDGTSTEDIDRLIEDISILKYEYEKEG